MICFEEPGSPNGAPGAKVLTIDISIDIVSKNILNTIKNHELQNLKNRF